jgi:tryptophanyl-tRNA synthetase
MAKKRIFSGVQPSGRLHIGNYVGALRNWVKLQDEYDCVYGIVDYHAVTVAYEPKEMSRRILDCAINFLACGLDPKRSILMLQSLVPEHVELAWLFNSVTPVGWLLRVPTFKEKRLENPKNVNMAMMDYPVLMAADILVYKADAVPVGEDQLPHLELTREIARRFNGTYGTVFPEPKEILGNVPEILGLDGVHKMSKSLDNCIYLDEEPASIEKKLATAVTDTNRKRRSDPGNPDVCNIYSIHKAFSTVEELGRIDKECRAAAIGCLDCKTVAARHIIEILKPIREKQQELWRNPDKVKDILREGSSRAQVIARRTLAEVLKVMGLYSLRHD